MTIIELLIGMSLILIITCISFPKISIEKYEMNFFMKQLCSDLRYVRKSNMLHDCNTYISFIKEDKRYGYIFSSNGKNCKKIFLPKKISLETYSPKIIFKGNGLPEKAGGSIRVFKDSSFERIITIVPTSGRILLKEGKYEK